MIVSVEVLIIFLYFHFDVIAFDHDFVTWNALLRWRPQNSPRVFRSKSAPYHGQVTLVP